MKFRLLILAALLPLLVNAAAPPTNSWKIVLTPSGKIDTRYQDGVVGTVCTWATIPNISVANGSSGTLDLRATYLTGTGCSSATVTLACSTSLPAGGFSYSGTTLTRTSTTSSTNSCTPTANGNTVGNSFLLVSSGNSADTTAPNVPSIVSVVPISTTAIDVTVLPLNDPAIPSATSSGLQDVRLYVNGSLNATTATAAGLSLPLVRTTLGDATGAGSSQSTTSWTISSTGSGDFYGTADNGVLLSPATGVSGDLDVVGYVASWSHSPAAFAKVGVGIRKTLDPPSAHATGVLFPDGGANGANLEHRLTAGASATQQARVASIVAPQCLWIHRVSSTNTETYYTSPNCNNWVQRQSATIGMPDPVFPNFMLGQLGAGNSASVTFAKASINNVAPVVFHVTGLTAGTTYTFTADARDRTGTPNVSAQSAGVPGTTMGAGSTAASWPRLGCYFIGGDRNYDSDAFIAYAQRMDVCILGIWDGWQIGHSKSWGASVQGIANSSPLTPKTKVYAYYNSIQDQQATTTSANSELKTVADANNWWLRNPYPAGSITQGFWDSSWKVMNPYPGGPTDGSGRTFCTWYAQYHLDINYTGGTYGTTNGGNSAAPYLSGLYVDDLFFYPYAGGDYTRTGSGGGLEIWPNYRLGVRCPLDYMKAQQASLKPAGNLSQYYSADSVAHNGEYLGYFNAGVLENMLGDNSGEYWGGTGEFKARYDRQWALLSGDKLGIIGAKVYSNGSDVTDGTAYRAAWYDMALTWILGDASIYFDSSGYYASENRLAFDYFAISVSGVPVTFSTATAAQLKWMGTPTGTSTTLPNGIILRFWTGGQFGGAFCAVNPKGNGTQNLLPSDVGGSGVYRRVTGSQRSGWDTGASFTSSLSMPARDGICMPKAY